MQYKLFIKVRVKKSCDIQYELLLLPTRRPGPWWIWLEPASSVCVLDFMQEKFHSRSLGNYEGMLLKMGTVKQECLATGETRLNYPSSLGSQRKGGVGIRFRGQPGTRGRCPLLPWLQALRGPLGFRRYFLWWKKGEKKWQWLLPRRRAQAGSFDEGLSLTGRNLRGSLRRVSAE